jgi:very-short-patch-repair endonuclease
MREQTASPDLVVAPIAARQHGVVSFGQLLAAGVGKDAVIRRVHAGRLHRVHRGVYSVGHAGLSQEGRWMAAVLACGDTAVLSHRSAAELLRLLPVARGAIHVTIPDLGGRARRPGIHIHRSGTLTDGQTTCRRSIPLTSPVRTLADLGGQVSAAQLRQATRQAEVLGLYLGETAEPAPTRSELEHLFLRLCRRHRLSPPEVNVRVDRFTVDFLWRDQALIVETDGYRYHRGRRAFEEDRKRDLELRLHGYQVLRFSYVQVVEEPRAVAAALRALL